MNKGLKRFTFYTDQLTELLNKSSNQENPALWLFNNNARAPFFMLEGLAKLYKKIHDPKLFDSLKDHFKLVEDGLGQTDYYYSLSLTFETNSQIPIDYKQYIKKQIEEKADKLNEILTDKDWLSSDNKRIIKTSKKLSEVDWLSPDDEVEAISHFYQTEIASINKFAEETNFHFTDVEKDVHELRRKIRWLSIYPQALQGLIQYAPETKPAPFLEKYLTEEIINSPYNKLPAQGDNSSIIQLHKNYFLALSWLIAKLGNLKDEGLRLTGLCEAIKQSTDCSQEEAMIRAYKLLGNKQRKMQEILDNAEVITKLFFEENNLKHLLAGTTKAV